MFGLFLRILAALLLFSAAAPADTTVTGKVVDADGNPVAGADVGTNWQFGEGAKPYGGVKSAEDGTFSITQRHWTLDATVLAMDAERERGAFASVVQENWNVTLKLQPLVTVTGRLDCNEPGVKPTGASLSWYAGERKVRMGNLYAPKSAWSLKLPPGAWRLYVFHVDLEPFTKDFVVKPGEQLDFGDIDIKPNLIATLAGKELPKWKVTDARGVEKTVQISDYKGKWVLVEFWGTW
ncbi:MAG: hypothetical protein HYY18_15740 [Planctomycetes bacterium]|nr:hypothetical protein [Planctomycetota bacterium]